jgi:hypothetical protein
MEKLKSFDENCLIENAIDSSTHKNVGHEHFRSRYFLGFKEQ